MISLDSSNLISVGPNDYSGSCHGAHAHDREPPPPALRPL